MKTSTFFRFSILPTIICCCLMIVPISIINAQNEYAVAVTAGWNMIGSVCDGVPLEIISTEPAGIILSQFYEYDGSYIIPEELKKGYGYWVKVSTSGVVKFNCQGAWVCGNTIYDSYFEKIYNTILIGNQCWMKENMNFGIKINGSEPQNENDAIEKYCYDDDPANCETYGGLYQWGEAMAYANDERARGICPPGWHIPTSGEFQTLSDAVGGDVKALMAIGQGEGTNTSGFSGLFAGDWNFDESNFQGLSQSTGFWSSTPFLSGAYSMYLTAAGNLFLTGIDERYGFSVRCLRD